MWWVLGLVPHTSTLSPPTTIPGTSPWLRLLVDVLLPAKRAPSQLVNHCHAAGTRAAILPRGCLPPQTEALEMAQTRASALADSKLAERATIAAAHA